MTDNNNRHDLHLRWFRHTLPLQNFNEKTEHCRGVSGNLCCVLSHQVICCDRGGLAALTKYVLDPEL